MKIIKYFFQFIIINNLFIIFKIIGYKNASLFGSKIGKIFGKLIRSDKIILKNISIIEEYLGTKLNNTDQIVNEVFSKELEAMTNDSKEVLDKMLAYIEKKYISVPMKMAKEIFLEK